MCTCFNVKWQFSDYRNKMGILFLLVFSTFLKRVHYINNNVLNDVIIILSYLTFFLNIYKLTIKYRSTSWDMAFVPLVNSVRSRSARIFVPSDQDIHCFLDSKDYSWARSQQCRSRWNGTDLPADRDQL